MKYLLFYLLFLCTFPSIAGEFNFHHDFPGFHRRFGHRPVWGSHHGFFPGRFHRPFLGIHHHPFRFHNPIFYHYTLPYRALYFHRWVRLRGPWDFGHRYWNDYPYYADYGYLHRYSSVDNCDYELVDGYNNQTVKIFPRQACNISYDLCATYRDEKNSSLKENRYFCSEKFIYNPNHRYRWNTRDHFYRDLINGDEDLGYHDDPVIDIDEVEIITGR